MLLIVIILAIVMIALNGYLIINRIENMQGLSFRETDEYIREARMITIIIVSSFGVISLAILLFASRVILSPISKLIKNAKKIAEGQEEMGGEAFYSDALLKFKEHPHKKAKSEIDELVKAFEVVTGGLKENLSEVNRQKQQMEAILLHMTDGIVAFSIEGGIIHINPAASRLLQVTSKEDTFQKIFRKLNIDINMERIIYLEDWTSTEEKAEIGDKNINMFFVPFKDENDRAAGVMVLIQDITEHVKLDNMRKEFVADVSHELKTPLTSIMGYSETLQEGDYDRELRQKFLKVINSEAIRMAKLVNDLLALSKFDDDKSNWEKTEFDLGHLVKKCQEKLQIEMDKKNIKTECFVTANVPKVFSDRDGIERAILNVLSNSVKYTKDEGTIKIYVGFLYNDAYIKIIDNGIGIPEQDLERIFERFYRVDKARTRSMGGTGLRAFDSKGNTR